MTVRTVRYTRIFGWLAMAALLLSSVLLPAPTYAQSSPTITTPALQVESTDGAVHLQWQGSVQSAAGDDNADDNAQATIAYGGYLLPIQTVLVELPADQAAGNAMAAVAVNGMSSTPYTGELTPAPRVDPPALDYVPSPTNTPYAEEPKLPSSPVFVMAEGWERGRHLATLGFSPIYQDANSGQILSVESIDATVAGASVVADDDATATPDDGSLFAPIPSLDAAPGPTNPLANANAFNVYVSSIGIQQLSGADLAQAGLDSPQASKLHLYFEGNEIPLQIIDSNHNDRVDDNDYIRFYGYSDGDAWNLQGIYWLSEGGNDGLRMTQRTVTAGGAPPRATAYEAGQYQKSNDYETTLAGGDGDNWFQAKLNTEAGGTSFAFTLPHQLPLNGDLPTVLTLNLTAYSIGAFSPAVNHRLQVTTNGFNTIDSWAVPFLGSYPYQNITRTLSLNKAADAWTLTLLNESTGRAVMVDAIDYLLPVKLDFGGKGANFEGVDGTWRYKLTGTPTGTKGGRGLYDITDPTHPVVLTIPGGAAVDFQDGPHAHRYTMTGDGTFFTPAIAAHKPVNLGAAGAAHEIYIAPAQFNATLQPLIDQRKSQGYQAKIVNVQAIYDSWSYGMVDAKAIRSFLRFAAGKWSPSPLAAVMVGDGTWDPHNFTGNNNPNVIPPYVADVDPWIKYVPCDSCYGQLDGDDPAEDYLVDIWIGRFPVINTDELTIVVNKIIRYENAKDTNALWRTTALELADDDIHPDNTVDTAGPFIGSTEETIKLMPSNIRQLRNYFLAATDLDAASTSLRNLINLLKPWFTSNSDKALQKTIDMMNSGVGLVTYTGHGNHWQWARIVAPEGPTNKWLFGLWEVLQLHNTDSPFISMSMTCYTSQFHIPALSHFTVDEHLFLYGNGGAITTWGPEGFSIVPAHDSLQKGFHQLLWKSPALKAKLGALTAAGYKEVFKSGNNLDATKTFAVMGDPLTAARVIPISTVYLPKLDR